MCDMMFKHYTHDEWARRYADQRFRSQLGRSSSVHTTVDRTGGKASRTVRCTFSFSCLAEDSSFTRDMYCMDDAIYGDGQKVEFFSCGPRIMEDGVLVDECLFDNVFFKHCDSAHTSEQIVGQDPSLFETSEVKYPGIKGRIEQSEGGGCENKAKEGHSKSSEMTLFAALVGIMPHRRIRFRHCFFECWEVPADLGHDMVFEDCIFDTPVRVSGRITSDIGFERCIFLSDFTVKSGQGLGVIMVGACYLRDVTVSDSIISRLSFLNGSVSDGNIRISGSRFRRELSFDDFCLREALKCRTNDADRFRIDSCTCEDVSVSNSRVSSFSLDDSRVRSFTMVKTSVEDRISVERTTIDADAVFKDVSGKSLSMQNSYVYRNLTLSTESEPLRVEKGCDLSNITVSNDFKFIRVNTGYVVLREGRFGNLFMSGCSISEKADLYEIEVQKKCSMTDSTMGDDIILTGSFFGGDVQMSNFGTDYKIEMDHVQIDGSLCLDSARCDTLDLRGSVTGAISMIGTAVDWEMFFDDIEAGSISISAENRTLESGSFRGMRVRGRFSLNDIILKDRVHFDDSVFDEGVELSGVEIRDGIVLRRSSFHGESSLFFKVDDRIVLLDFTDTTFRGPSGNADIGIYSPSSKVKLNIDGLITDVNIRFHDFVFDEYKGRPMRRVLARVFGESMSMFCNLCTDDWEILKRQWAALERIYQIRNELELQKDAYVWKCFCERHSLRMSASPERC